jgi:3-oxoacyl-(acyl-carrier-protein) synthase
MSAACAVTSRDAPASTPRGDVCESNVRGTVFGEHARRSRAAVSNSFGFDGSNTCLVLKAV